MRDAGRATHQSQDGDLLNLPFDLYQRYVLIRTLVARLWPGREARGLLILDVGGHSSPLKNFLPSCEVVLVDVQPPGSFTTIPLAYDTYLLGSGAKLPLATASFDLVIANDTLEHLPEADRPAFLRELLRVSRRFVIVNGPTYDPQTADAEERFAKFLRKALRTKSDFLQEHLELGLPKGEDVETVLRKEGLSFIEIPNGNLTLWLTMNAAKNYVIAFPDAEQLGQTLDRAYNLVLSPQDFGGLCYRNAYVIAKKPSDAEALRHIKLAFSSSLERAAALGSVGALEELLSALEDHAVRARRFTQRLQATIAELQFDLKKAAATLASKEAAIAERDAALSETEAALVDTQAQLHGVQAQLQAATNTVGYRLLERTRGFIRRLAPPGSRRHIPFTAFSRGMNVILSRGLLAFLSRLVRIHQWLPRLWSRPLPATPESLDDQYQVWLEKHSVAGPRARKLKKIATRLAYRPLLSVIMPVYNTELRWLREAIDSVRAQLYDNWELCIGDDGSTQLGVREILEEYAAKDPRIKVTHLETNQGISAASNAALSLARGEFVGFLDHDDELKPDALFEVVKLLNEKPDLDFIYTDEDHRSKDGRLVQPFFKPDWSPDLLLSVNYVPHFTVYRKRLVDEVGALRSDFDLSQDYDLTLRVTERTDRIGHIPLPVYTWRMAPNSASSKFEAKLQATEVAKKALKEATERRGLPADILDGSEVTTYRVRYRIKGQPRVSIIIPTRDRVELLRRCIASIEKKSTYPNREIVIVDNDSSEKETLEYFEKSPYSRLAYPGPFDYSAMMNFAAAGTTGEYLLLLNNDTEVIAPDWIEAMLEQCQRPEVGAVGARLLYPDGRIQHEGIIIGLAGGCAANVDHHGYFGLGELVHNCTAVTAACMMTRRDVFERLGGFEEKLGVAYNDVDYCLRAFEQGYLNVYVPHALLYHHEGGTRGWGIPEENLAFFYSRWGKPGEYRDPYYNPNLDLLRPFNIRL